LFACRNLLSVPAAEVVIAVALAVRPRGDLAVTTQDDATAPHLAGRTADDAVLG
jgi:hypothetical protein